MNEHFIEALDPRFLPPPATRSLAQQLIAASHEWGEVRKQLQTYNSSRSAISGTNLFVSLSRFVHELIPDQRLRDHIIQHIETRILAEFPPAPGKLL